MKKPLIALLATTTLLAGFPAVGAGPVDRESFRMRYLHKGYETERRYLQGLSISVQVKQTGLHEDKLEICAEFLNQNSYAWRGGYRLTHRDDWTTFASVKVDPYMTVRRCEILPASEYYHINLRRDERS